MFSRRALIAPIVLLVLLAAGYSAFWAYAAASARDAVTDWLERLRADGVETSHGEISTTGFPMLIRLEVAEPAIASGSRWRWRAGAVAIEMQPWDFSRFRIEPAADHRLDLRLREDGPTYRFGTGSAVAVARVHANGRLASLGVQVSDLKVTTPAGRPVFAAQQIWFEASQPAIAPKGHRDQALDLSLVVGDAEVGEDAPLGKEVAKLHVAGEVLGPLAGETPVAALEAWRDAGGVLEVRWLNLVWGALDLRAKGTLALDETLRPLGALTADLRGYGQALDALAAAGLMRPGVTRAARVALDLLAKPSEVDGRRVLTVPLTLQDGGLYAGPVRLFAVPAIARSRSLPVSPSLPSPARRG